MHVAFKSGAGISGICGELISEFPTFGKPIPEFSTLGNPIPEFVTVRNPESGKSSVDFFHSARSGFLKSESGMLEIPDYFRLSGAIVQHWNRHQADKKKRMRCNGVHEKVMLRSEVVLPCGTEKHAMRCHGGSEQLADAPTKQDCK